MCSLVCLGDIKARVKTSWNSSAFQYYSHQPSASCIQSSSTHRNGSEGRTRSCNPCYRCPCDPLPQGNLQPRSCCQRRRGEHLFTIADNVRWLTDLEQCCKWFDVLDDIQENLYVSLTVLQVALLGIWYSQRIAVSMAENVAKKLTR